MSDEPMSLPRRVVAALEYNNGVLLPAVQKLMAEAWEEGRDAEHREMERMYSSQCEGDCDCNEPITNPYRAEAERRGE